MNPCEPGTWMQGLLGDSPSCFGQTTGPMQNIAAAGYTPQYHENVTPDAMPAAAPAYTPKPMGLDF